MTRIVLLSAGLTAAAIAFAALPAQAACDFKKVAELPVTMRGLRPLVPAKINGQQVLFTADSGAFISTMTWPAANKTGVKGRGSYKGVHGVSGEAAMDVGVAQSFELAGISLGSATFLIGGAAADAEDAGLLGQNLLGRFDVEYDLANGVIRLFTVADCKDAYLAYWSADHQAGMLTLAPRSRRRPDIVVSASVNGQPIRAILDTGSSSSLLKVTSAAKAGIKTSSDGVAITSASYGVSGRRVDTWLAPVASFAFGDEQIRNTRLRISDIELPDADMLIGADFFLSHRIFVSNSQSRLYFTYNGGPVFHLDGPAPAKAAAGAATGEPLADSDAYARRAAASAARRDYATAYADYAKAIELDARAPGPRLARAMLYAQQDKNDLALADLDEALRLAPGDTKARMLRARLYLVAKDLPRARADLDATLKDVPVDSTQAFEVAALLREQGEFREALGHYDRWIATHADSKRMQDILNQRCWTRAIWGQELDKALADCDAAIGKGRRFPPYLDSRGLVHLRLGQLDAAIADYDAVLRMDPKTAWSLYGRGLARRKKGLTAAGDADIAQATALAPGLPALAKRYGLEPEGAAPQAALVTR